MKTLMSILFFALTSKAALADYCQFEFEVEWDARELAREANEFARNVEYSVGSYYLSQDARELAQAARMLENTANGYNYSCTEIKAEFRFVSDAFRYLQNSYKDAYEIRGRNDLQYDYRRVVDSFQDLSRSVRELRVTNRRPVRPRTYRHHRPHRPVVIRPTYRGPRIVIQPGRRTVRRPGYQRPTPPRRVYRPRHRR